MSSDGDSDGFIDWDHKRRQSCRKDTAEPNNDTTTAKAATRPRLPSRTGSISAESKSEDIGIGNGPSPSEDFDDEYYDEDDYADKWSVRVRLISAVDLPPHILPFTPLCPVFKVGLLTLPEANESEVDNLRLMELSKTGLSQLKKTKNPGGEAAGTEEDDGQNNPDSLSGDIQHSSGKIMSNADNGMMEWHEEMRWDDVSRPLQTVLAVELSARSVLPPSMADGSSGSNGKDGLSQPLNYDALYEEAMQQQQSKGDSASISSSNSQNDDSLSGTNNGSEEQGSGIFKLWRRSRQNYEQRRKRNTSLNSNSSTGNLSQSATPVKDKKDEIESASAAAAVARYIMENDGEPSSIAPTVSTGSHSNAPSVSNNGGELNAILDEIWNDDSSTTSNRRGSLDSLYSGNNQMKKIATRIDSNSEGDLKLGTLVIPLSDLPLEQECPKVEKWYQLETEANRISRQSSANSETKVSESTTGTTRRSPSVLLEVTLCASLTLDQKEEETYSSKNAQNLDEDSTRKKQLLHSTIPAATTEDSMNSIYGEQTSERQQQQNQRREAQILQQQRLLLEEKESIRQNGPFLEPGIVDFICVVGAKNIGDRKNDDGSKGWVSTVPDCAVLEQFPESDDVHAKNGRSCALPNMVEWWCFPEGCKIWRGTEPPTHMDMNLKRFSASSPPSMATSIAAFDACLNCTTSFMWWVISSNSDEYGSQTSKTYGAVIRFYAPAPLGVDPTQDDFAQSNSNDEHDTVHKRDNGNSTRLWCPLAICLTSSQPIVGIMECLLLRVCEKLASRGSLGDSLGGSKIHSDILNLIFNYPSPTAGLINCSFPFLSTEGDRLLASLPPVGGLSAVPHGTSVTSVCRLLGAEGLTALLAAVLTECKILIHSADVANLAMVAEVVTAMIYPFRWQLPYIPVLPLSMMEFLEAPLSYFLGVPSCNMKWMDKAILSDVVVIDLDNGFSSPDYFDGRRSSMTSKTPNPLPPLVSSNISKAVFRLLREEEEVEEQYRDSHFGGGRHLPRLDGESLAEREFRIAIAQQICSLVRGYQDCLFFVSASQPVFNRDRFLRQAPALFDGRKGTGNPASVGSNSISRASTSQRLSSPRSKRFLSSLVNTQHFHSFLEQLDSDSITFFHEIMATYEEEHDQVDISAGTSCIFGSPQQEDAAEKLKSILDDLERKTPTYHVQRQRDERDEDERVMDALEEEDELLGYQEDDDGYLNSFTNELLQSVTATADLKLTESEVSESSEGVRQVSIEQLIELEKNPWSYSQLFNIEVKPKQSGSEEKKSKSDLSIWPKTQLREAIGERKFRKWKLEEEKKNYNPDDVFKVSPLGTDSASNAVDLTSLIKSADTSIDVSRHGSMNLNEISKFENDSLDRKAGLADREAVRKCLEYAYESTQTLAMESGENQNLTDGSIYSEAEAALRNPFAQSFLISVLSQISQIQDKGKKRQSTNEISVAPLLPVVFECLKRLCDAMLEACKEDHDFEAAYTLLTHTVGFCSLIMPAEDEPNKTSEVVYMTKRICMHPIFADLSLWERVLLIHKKDRQRDKNSGGQTTTSTEEAENKESEESDDYEAAVSTLYEMLGYGMPSDQLAKFASRISQDKFLGTEREQKLLMLARRLVLKCDDVADGENDLNLLSDTAPNVGELRSVSEYSEENIEWEEINWVHPPTSNLGDGGRSTLSHNSDLESLIKKNPITKLVSFGSSVVASGALDGSIYVAPTLDFEHSDPQELGNLKEKTIEGIHLEWGGKRSNTSAVYDRGFLGVGAVSCLAAMKDAYFHGNYDQPSGSEDDHFLKHIGNSSLIAGTTNGDLRSWALKDIMAVYMSKVGSGKRNNSVEEVDCTDILRGKALGGHRGGVSCLDIPSQMYRPDSVVSGGKDGLIKLWTLRSTSSKRTSSPKSKSGRPGRKKPTGLEPQDILTGHGGKILTLQTAWHGDRLLSGGVDKTLKLWDLTSSGGKCVLTMEGHNGLITKGRYWGRNTLVSASTDRTVALWDARAGSSPLFVLQHHRSPVSDICIPSYSGHLMVSASGDGSVATWDFRKLSGHAGQKVSVASGRQQYLTQAYREPLKEMTHGEVESGVKFSSPVLLADGFKSSLRSVLTVGLGGKIKEWDITQGKVHSEHETGHAGFISCFSSFSENCGVSERRGTITASFDGTVRFRRNTCRRDST